MGGARPCLQGALVLNEIRARPRAPHRAVQRDSGGSGPQLRRASKTSYGRLAPSYDRLRPVDDNWWEVFDALVEHADLLGRRVLDVGCGTGVLAAALAERGSRVWGVDASEEMLAQAAARAGRALAFKPGVAEDLPFKDGWFERVVFRLVVHVVDRHRAFAESRRVLAPGGRVAIATFDPKHFDQYWLNDFFPDVKEIDRARFPEEEALAAELLAGGFASTNATRISQVGRLTRESAIERIRGRFISTLGLLDDDAYNVGLARAERALPEVIENRLEWLLVVAQ
jgi:ubiquinone/menaquinone biosynthesis C-methylase UbiE